jgi:hypothetical protein
VSVLYISAGKFTKIAWSNLTYPSCEICPSRQCFCAPYHTTEIFLHAKTTYIFLFSHVVTTLDMGLIGGFIGGFGPGPRRRLHRRLWTWASSAASSAALDLGLTGGFIGGFGPDLIGGFTGGFGPGPHRRLRRRLWTWASSAASPALDLGLIGGFTGGFGPGPHRRLWDPDRHRYIYWVRVHTSGCALYCFDFFLDQEFVVPCANTDSVDHGYTARTHLLVLVPSSAPTGSGLVLVYDTNQPVGVCSK